jgi:hypothetical protein
MGLVSNLFIRKILFYITNFMYLHIKTCGGYLLV